MVDRIDKLKPTESWKIQETNPSKKDKRNQSEEEKQQDAKSSFEERPDWNRLIAKEGGGSGNLFTRNVKSISFRHPQHSSEEGSKSAPHITEDGSKAKPSLKLPSFTNKTEVILLVITGILLLVLIYLISRFFV